MTFVNMSGGGLGGAYVGQVRERSKGTPVTKVKNQEVIDALVALGFASLPRLADVVKGAQSTTFQQRLVRNGVPQSVVDLAFRMARGEIAPEAYEAETQGVFDALSPEEAQRMQTSAWTQRPAAPDLGGTSTTGNLLAGTTKGVGSRAASVKAQPGPDPNASGGGGGGGGGASSYAPPSLPAPKTYTPAERRAALEGRFGWAAGLMDEPEVARIVNDVASGAITEDEAEVRYRGTDYFKHTTQVERDWTILKESDPAEAAVAHTQQLDVLNARVKKLGVTIPQERLVYLAEVILAHGWNDVQIDRYLSAEIRFDPQGKQAGIFQDIQDASQEFLVPLSDQAKTTWAQSIVSGDQTAETFRQYLRDSAVSLFPALATAMQDPNMTVRKYLDPYNQTIAKSLGINEADIDWTDPKWQRFVSQIDPKTNQRTVMGLADVQRTLVSDPIYGWDKTANGQQAQMGVKTQLLDFLGITG